MISEYGGGKEGFLASLLILFPRGSSINGVTG